MQSQPSTLPTASATTSQGASAPSSPAAIRIGNIRARDSKRGGRVIPGPVAVGHNADIERGVSIRLHGVETNRREPVAYDRTFRIGDTAEYGSYNLHYLGTIVAIGAATVTIAESGHSSCPRRHRLDLYDFSWRNRLLDLEQIAKRNHDTLSRI